MELKKRIEINQIKEGLLTEQPEEEKIEVNNSTPVVSTGSTLLDLAISGHRRYGGGIPGGILVQFFGPSGWGKTSILSEICASAQAKGGFAMIGDAERRMTPEFIQYMGLRVNEDNLKYPFTVDDIEEMIFDTPQTGEGIIDVTGIDSVTSLLSSQEVKKNKKTEEEIIVKDKRGSAKAKDLHGLCRRSKAELAKKNKLVVFTDQIQDNQTDMPFASKEKVPGGNAVPFYASLRGRIGPTEKFSKMKIEVKVGKVPLEKVIGIRSEIEIIKSSIDAPYQNAIVPIEFDYGIDDIRGNLEYIKRMTGNTKFWAVDDEFQSYRAARDHVEKNNLEEELKRATIDLWLEIEEKFKELTNRKPKQR